MFEPHHPRPHRFIPCPCITTCITTRLIPAYLSLGLPDNQDRTHL
ncbi:hypothetical protein M3J09_004834 [Ascochyta lentis]